MFFNDVAVFYERSPHVFDGLLQERLELNLLLPHRAELQILCSAGNSLLIFGYDSGEQVVLAYETTPGEIYSSGFLFTEIEYIGSDSFKGTINAINHDGSPVVIKQELCTIPVAVSQTIPSRRTASLLRIDNEGANPSDFFVISWPGNIDISLKTNLWVSLKKLGVRGVLQEITALTNPSTGVMFRAGYVKISTDID